MQKIIRQHGNSLVIKIDKEDKEILNLEKGDLVEVTIQKITKNNNEKQS